MVSQRGEVVDDEGQFTLIITLFLIKQCMSMNQA